MELHKSTSLEITELNQNLSDQARHQCEQAREQEEAGNFESARQLLNGFWQRVGERPNLEGLDGAARAQKSSCGRNAHRLDR